MSVKDYLNSAWQPITLDVRIAGRPHQAQSVTITSGLSQINATATIDGIERGGATEGDTVEIWAGYGGETEKIFGGEISGVNWRHFPGNVPLVARDILARVRYNWGGNDRIYNNQDDAAIIRNILEAYGIPSSMANIESSDWTLGTVLDVVLPSGKSGWSLIAEIDSLAGYRTFTSKNGEILRRRVSGSVGTGSIWTLEHGVNIISIDRSRNVEDINNRIIVTGIDYDGIVIGGPGVADVSAENPWIPTPPTYVTKQIQSNLIEDNDKAQEIANRELQDKNRRPESYSVETLYNPYLVPGAVVTIKHPEVEMNEGRFLIDSVQHEIVMTPPRAVTRITTLGGLLVDTGLSAAPISTFTAELFAEAASVEGVPSAIIVVKADGSASYDPDGEIVTWSWEVTAEGGTITNEVTDGPIYTATLTGDPTELTIKLVVADADGMIGVSEQTLPVTKNELTIEPLYLAWDGMVSCSSDGEQTWNDWNVTGMAVTAPFAAGWGTLFGDAGGTVYATTDYLATAPVSLGKPNASATVTALYIHEAEPFRIWAAYSDGSVYLGFLTLGTSPVATWNKAGEIPEGPITEIREALGPHGTLKATAGTGYWVSFDSGATWTKLHTFDVAWRMAAGYERNIATGLNTDPPIYEENGLTPTVPAGVTHLRGITFGWRTPALYAADDNAVLYLSDSTFEALEDSGEVAPAGVNHMIRSGNADGVIYGAAGDGTGDNGLFKWLPGVASPWWIRVDQDRQCNMVGYGPAVLPEIALDFVFGTYGNTDPGWDGFWRYTDGIWSHIAPPQPGWLWVDVKSHPRNKNRWLVLGWPSAGELYEIADTFPYYKTSAGVSPVWETFDGGLTWREITLTPPTNASWPTYNQFIHSITYQEQSGSWYVIGMQGALFSAASIVWQGNTNPTADFSYTQVPTATPTTWGALRFVASGLNGDVVVSEPDAPGTGTGPRLGYLLAGNRYVQDGCWIAPNSGAWNQPNGPFTIGPNREIFMADRGTAPNGLVWWEDYRVRDPNSDRDGGREPDVLGSFASIHYMADNHVIYAGSVNGGDSGIWRRPADDWQPSTPPDATYSTSVWTGSNDPQTKRLCVFHANNGATHYFIAWTGKLFVTISLPEGMTGGVSGAYMSGSQYGPPYSALGSFERDLDES